MSTPSPACHLIMEGELDIFCRDGSQMLRAASHDRGDHFQGLWQAPALLPIGSESPAVAGSADGRIVHLLARQFDISPDRAIFHARTTNYMGVWDKDWTRIPGGTFTSGPAVACSGRGTVLYACGRGDDSRYWMAKSVDAGSTWAWAWRPVGPGVFKGQPGLATTADGATVIAAGLGMDDHLWFARSQDGAENWNIAWSRIGPEPFVPFVPYPDATAAAVALSADGKALYVMGHREDKQIYWNRSPDLGKTWSGWKAISGGSLLSSPSVVTSWDGAHVYVTGLGMDRRVWFARSFDGGGTWNVAWKPVLTKTFA